MARLEGEHGEDTLCGRLFSAGHTRICGIYDSLGVCSEEVARGNAHIIILKHVQDKES